MFTVSEIRDRLQARPAAEIECGGRVRAAVALVVREAGGGPEILFIQRAEHDRDPWSGHLGFPGGRVDPADPGPRQAAERETLEEVGLDLAGAEYLGRLDDLTGAGLPVVVSCFVFGIGDPQALAPDRREVADAFWFPLSDLLDRRRHLEMCFRFGGRESSYPAIRVLKEGRPCLWGITYRLVAQLLQVLGRPF